MSHESPMPGYRPLDIHPSEASAEDSALATYAQEQRQELERLRDYAGRKISEITNRINEYEVADRAIPEGIITELEKWVDIAQQITKSLILDLLSQQSLEIEMASSLIEDKAPVVSWFQKVADFFRQTTSKPNQSAESLNPPDANENSLNPHEFATAQDALADLYYTLENVFCRLPNLRVDTTLVRAVLITSILFTLLPRASANAPTNSYIDNPTSPPAQVSEATLPEHLNTPLTQPISNHSTPLSTPPLATPYPASKPEITFTQPQVITQTEAHPKLTPTTTNSAKPENSSAGESAILHVQLKSLNKKQSYEGQNQEIIQTPNILLVTDQQTTHIVDDYIAQSPVSIPDFKLPELAQLPDDMKNALAATNVAIVDTDRPDHLFAHGSLVLDDQGNLYLQTVTHVLFNHFYQQEGGVSMLKSSSSIYLVITDGDELHYYRIQLNPNDIFIDPTGKQDGLTKIRLRFDASLSDPMNNFPTIRPISYSRYKRETFGEEGQPGSAVVFTSAHPVINLRAQSWYESPEFGTLCSWAPTDASPLLEEPITKEGDSGRGVFAEIEGRFYLVGVIRGSAQSTNPAGMYGQFDNAIMTYPFN